MGLNSFIGGSPGGSKDKLQSAFRWLAVAVSVVSFFCAVWINFGIRMPREAEDKTVGLLVDYDELKRIADGSHDIRFADMARKAALAGATGLVIRERILAEWESAGELLVYSGAQLAYLNGLLPPDDPDKQATTQFETDKTYILVKDRQVHGQIFSILQSKRRYPETFLYAGYQGIAVSLSSNERATMGLGFPLARLEEAAAEGLQIIPRFRNWEPFNEESLSGVLDWAAHIPNLAAIGFNDMTVPGGGTDPVLQDMLAQAIEPLGVPLVSFEFYDQVGLPGLATRLENNLIRAHAIAENELRRYADIEDAIARFNLAVTERNIRYVYLRFYGLENPAASMLDNLDFISFVKAGLEEEGFKLGDPTPIRQFHVPYVLTFMLGTGVIAVGGWLLAFVAGPFVGRKWLVPYVAALLAGCVLWAGLLAYAPGLGRKFMALSAAILFPSLGIVLALTWKPSAVVAGGRTTPPSAPTPGFPSSGPAESPGPAGDKVSLALIEQTRDFETAIAYDASAHTPDIDAWHPDNAHLFDENPDTRPSDMARFSDNARLFGSSLLADETPPPGEAEGADGPEGTPIPGDTTDSMAGNVDGIATPWNLTFRFHPPSFVRAVVVFLAMSAFSLAGAMIMSALLADISFMLKLDSFVGVKIAHMIPLMLVPMALWLREKAWYTLLSDTIKSHLRLWQLGAGLILLVGLAVYILRTGNDGLGAVSGLETLVRQYLDRILVVRPRTKEFLIGHPLMLVLIYFGYRFSMFPVLVLGVIGQVSLINTYAHIHTPLAISLLRSANGIWIGILLGLAGIAVILSICRVGKTLQESGGNPDGFP